MYNTVVYSTSTVHLGLNVVFTDVYSDHKQTEKLLSGAGGKPSTLQNSTEVSLLLQTLAK